MRNHPDHVVPVVGIIGLDHQKARRLKCPVDVGKESRRDDPAMRLADIVVGLGMVEVNLGDRGLPDGVRNKDPHVVDHETDIIRPRWLALRVA